MKYYGQLRSASCCCDWLTTNAARESLQMQKHTWQWHNEDQTTALRTLAKRWH